MTPFGIRKKLKSILGLGGSDAASTTPKEQEVPTYKVDFVLPDGSSFTAKAKEGDTLVMSSNRDLEADVASGRFRRDLYYRIAGIGLHMPPLRERPQDIPLIVGARPEGRMGNPLSVDAHALGASGLSLQACRLKRMA